MNKAAMYVGISLIGSALAASAGAQVRTLGRVTSFTEPAHAAQMSSIDFAHAQAMPMPTPAIQPPSMSDAMLQTPVPMGTPGSSPGGHGDGVRSPIQLAPTSSVGSQDQVSPQEFGTSGQPFTTNRVNAAGDNTTAYYPNRIAGKLFFNIGSSTYLCSASLIKPGIVVTAAHCVANFGQRQFYSNWQFVPAYNNGSAPYGVWRAASATVLTAYYAGTDPCAQSGVICQDDVAVLTLQSQSGSYAGNRTGWYGYGWNGYGFNGSSQGLIDQLGYPVALDGGLLMQRNDSQGFKSSSFSNNTIIGSLMTGGSSGGPWLVNLGVQPSLNGTSFGSAAQRNTVVGVTSWGYVNTAVKQQGASSFTSGNIVVLVNTVCSATPGAC